MAKITVSQVTNQDLVKHFEVSILNEIYAENAKGRRFFLTDLREKYTREYNKKATQKANAKKYRQTTMKVNRQENIDEFFVELDRAFPNYEVKIRNTQPGLELKEIGLQVFCMVDAFNRHALSFHSLVFSREDLENEFGYYKILKKDETEKNSITIGSLKFDEMIEVIQKAINMHEAAK